MLKGLVRLVKSTPAFVITVNCVQLFFIVKGFDKAKLQPECRLITKGKCVKCYVKIRRLGLFQHKK